MDVERVRLIGIKCRNLKANKWEQTQRQFVGSFFWAGLMSIVCG